MYLQSVFVPIGRGGASLDCFRMYEAFRAGAIPVVVGPKEEVERTFSTFVGSEGRLAPCVYSETWLAAVDAMKAIMLNTTMLLDYHLAALHFWSSSLSKTRAIVEGVLGTPIPKPETPEPAKPRRRKK